MKRYAIIFDEGYKIVDTSDSGYIYYKNEDDELIRVEEGVEDNYVENLGKCLFEIDEYDKDKHSEITFKDICGSSLGAFVKVVWNGKTVYDDDGKLMGNIENKHIYSFYCNIVDCHHTELYIEGEQL